MKQIILQRSVLHFLLLLLLSFSQLGCVNSSTTADKFVVGIVNINPGVLPIIESFKQRMQELSDQAGRELVLIESDNLTANELNTELFNLRQQGVDLVLVTGTGPTLKVINVFKETGTAVLFSPLYDPVRSGVVDKLRHSDPQVTGIKVGGSNAKALSFLKMANPSIKKIWVPLSGLSVVESLSFDDLKVAADKLEIELVFVQTKTRNELKAKLDTIPSDIDALWLMHSMFLPPNHKLFVASAIKHKLLLASGTGLGQQGVMISYSQDFTRTGQQAARLANQIASGVSPKDIPVEKSDFFLSINLKTARLAGVEIPELLLRQADYIYYD